jgi:DNA processing protein
MVPGLGNIACRNLLDKFGTPENIFQANISDLREVDGVRKEVTKKIANREFLAEPLEELRRVEKCGARIITYTDPIYPKALKEIYDPPAVLYVKGKDIPYNATFVAVVGSRNPTPYGLKSAEKIGQGLARRGLGVVSGMARGIDSAAHWGCLGGRGFTIGVLGTGIDVIYPKSNKKLMQQIIQKGAVISEFPLGTQPEPKNFPGREVFAVPGSIHSFKSTGCHLLIKQGASLIENSDDVLDELGLNYEFASRKDTFEEEELLPPMGQPEKEIYDLIGDYPIHIDQIARQGNLEPSEASSILMRMELKGLIRQLPGKMFVR